MQYLLCPISFCFPSLNSIISPVKMLQLGLCRIRYSEDLQTLCDSASLTPRNQDLSKNSFSTSVQFSRSVVSDSLQPRGLQHTRPPCPPPTPRARSNSCPFCNSLNRLSWWLSGKESACQWRRHGKILWRRKWQPIQCSCLGNTMDKDAWRATVLGVVKSQTPLND